jgi:hypothetical protein
MFRIDINNESLDLGSVSVTFDLRNPIFNDIGSFSYPFNLPNTPKNRALLGFPDKINYGGSTPKSQQADIYIDGMIWKRGIIVVRDANEKHIRVNFGVGEGYFFNLIKDLKMNEVDLGGNRLASNYADTYRFFKDHYHLLYPDIDFTLFPFKMPEFFSENDYYHAMHNDSFINGYINLFITQPIPGPDPTINFFSWALTPFPFVNYWMKQLFNQINISFKTNSLYDDAQLRQLVFWKNLTISEEWSPTQEFDFPYQFDLSDGFPENNISEFFSHIEKLFRAHLFYNEFDNSAKLLFIKDILNAAPVEIDGLFKKTNIEPNNYDGYEMTYDAPGGEDYFEKFIKSIKGFNYKGSVLFQFQLPDYTTSPTVKDVYFVESEQRFFWWHIKPGLAPINGSWQYFTSELLSDGEGNRKMKVNIPGIFPRNIFRSESGNKGQWFTYQDIDKKTEPCEIRMLFAHGVHNGKPFGSHYNRLDNGPIIAPYSLEWSGPYGLKKNFYKEWLHFNATTRAAEYTMPLSAARLKQIDFSKKYRWDQTNWLIDTIRFTVTNHKISPAKVTVKKCK